MRRWPTWAVLGTLTALGLVYLLRFPLTAAAVTSALRMAGAGEIKLSVSASSPWKVVLDDVGFNVRTQAFSARRITMERRNWWMPSLGALRVEAMRVPVTIDGSDTNPWAWDTYAGQAAAPSQTVMLPVEEISIDGQIVVRAAALPDQTLTVTLTARLTENSEWEGQAQATAPGLAVKVVGNFRPAADELRFRLPEVSLDLQRWQNFLQRMVVLPGGRWDLAGQFSGSAEGRVKGKDVTLTGQVKLRDGRLDYPEKKITLTGVEADIAFDDMWNFKTQAGQTARAQELKVGELTLRDLGLVFAVENSEKVAISHASLKALGGTLTAEPFKLFANQRELELTVLADGLDVEQILAVAPTVPARASGRVDGRLPLRIDAGGLRLGTGWLALKPGVYAEIQFNANGLLTNGVDPKNPRFAVLNKIESGLLRLKVGEMRLEVRPPNAPAGRSATLRVTGEPVDPTVKAPVTLDLNVNGPLERLINLGLDSRVSVGKKK